MIGAWQLRLFFFLLEPSLYPEKLKGSGLNRDGQLNITWTVSPIISHICGNERQDGRRRSKSFSTVHAIKIFSHIEGGGDS